MYLSVVVKSTDQGYVPRLVFQNPTVITVFDVGAPCSTWKEAFIVARARAKDTSYVHQQVRANA